MERFLVVAKKPRKPRKPKSEPKHSTSNNGSFVAYHSIHKVDHFEVQPVYRKKAKTLSSTLGSTKRGDVIYDKSREQIGVVIDDLSEQLFVQPLESTGNDQWFVKKRDAKFVTEK